MPINLTTKYSSKVEERFKLKSLTDAYAGHAYDFDGVRTIRIYSVDSVPIVNYTRSGLTRFGSPIELGDTLQELTMTQDRSFSFTVDAGNSADQLNIKHASKRLRTNWDEVATPEIDKYRFGVWMNGAGLGAAAASALTDATIIRAIMTATGAMSNALVPLSNRVLFVKESLYIEAKLAPQIIGIDTLGAKAVANGQVGTLDGMPVVRVPDSYFPAGVNFFIKYKGSTVDPMKLKTFRVHKGPPGIDGDLAECRFYHDAFVLANKVNGLYVHALSANAVAAPTFNLNAGNLAITTATSASTIMYTIDGTSPKSTGETATAQQYSAAISGLASGTLVRAFAKKDGLVASPISEYKIA